MYDNPETYTEQNPFFYHNYPIAKGIQTTIAIWVENVNEKAYLCHSVLSYATGNWSKPEKSNLFAEISIVESDEIPNYIQAFGFLKPIEEENEDQEPFDITPALSVVKFKRRVPGDNRSKKLNASDNTNSPYVNDPNQKMGRPKKKFEELSKSTQRMYKYYERKEEKEKIAAQTPVDKYREHVKVQIQHWFNAMSMLKGDQSVLNERWKKLYRTLFIMDGKEIYENIRKPKTGHPWFNTPKDAPKWLELKEELLQAWAYFVNTFNLDKAQMLQDIADLLQHATTAQQPATTEQPSTYEQPSVIDIESTPNHIDPSATDPFTTSPFTTVHIANGMKFTYKSDGTITGEPDTTQYPDLS